MSSSTEKKKCREAATPIKVVDYPYYMPPPYVDQERVKELSRSLREIANNLREIANKHNIQIEMPVHDEAWIYLPDPFEDRGEGGVE